MTRENQERGGGREGGREGKSIPQGRVVPEDLLPNGDVGEQHELFDQGVSLLQLVHLRKGGRG
jgi:hypothetical protein